MPVEDGCLVFMTALQSKDFFAASISGTEFSMSTDSMSFHLRWSSPWPSPARPLLTTKAIFSFSPSESSPHTKTRAAASIAAHIEQAGVILLRQPSDDRNFDAAKFAKFVEAIDEVIRSTVPKAQPASLPQGWGICVQFRLPFTDSSTFKLATSSSEANSVIPTNIILEKLGGLPRINIFVISDVMEAQILYDCWGFQTAQFGPPPAP